MNYRQKCKTKGEWAFIKYLGDAAIYAVCQNDGCGFTYPCYKNEILPDGSKSMKCVPDLKRVFKYCPQCGLKMHLFNGKEIYKIDRFPWE